MKKTPPVFRMALFSHLKKTVAIMLLFITTLFAQKSIAQCPSSISGLTVSNVIAATCPSNGSFTVTVPTSYANLVNFEITAGPDHQTGLIGPESATFNSLYPGTYTVRASCINNPATYQEVNVTIINDGYVPIDGSLAVSNLCNGGNAGTITATVTGGSTTGTQFAIWPQSAGGPDRPESEIISESLYGTATVFNVAAFGTYNVRFKDACGAYVTKQIEVANPYPANLKITSVGPWVSGNIACVASQPNINAWVRLESNGVWITHNLLPAAGVTIEVYEDLNNNCAVDAGELLPSYTTVINPARGNDDILIPRMKRLVIRMINPCGAVSDICYRGDNEFGQPGGSIGISQDGCTGGTVPTVTLNIFMNEFTTLPYNYVVKNSLGVTVASGTSTTRSQAINGLPYGDTYTFEVTDACGQLHEFTTAVASLADPVSAQLTSTTRANCTNESGTVTAQVRINGSFPGLALSGTTLVITSSPGAGNAGKRVSGRSFEFYNLIPGTTYTALLTAPSSFACALPPQNVTFTVPPGATSQALQQSIILSAQQLCATGAGIGNIILNSVYNGYGHPTIRVYKTGVTTPIYTGSGGNITLPNQGEGSYYATMTIYFNPSYGCGTGYELTSNTVVIQTADAAPVITRKYGAICEDANGTPGGTGSAFVSFYGKAPFRFYYKLKTDPETAFQQYPNATTTFPTSPANVTVNGLLANTTYDIRIVDACGNSIPDEVTIGVLESINIEQTQQPCVGVPYTLSVPDYVNATYTWSKGGVTFATTRQYTFPSFNASNAGEYQCVVVVNGCIVRRTTVTLYVDLCESPIGDITLEGNVFNDANGLKDGMVNGPGTNAGGTIYVHLVDATNNEVIDYRAVSATGEYSFGSIGEGNYLLILSATPHNAGTVLTESDLPGIWESTGENHGLPTTTGNDGDVDGILAVTVGAVDIDNLNFGIERAPNSYDEIKIVEGAPVVGTPVNLGDVPMEGSDIEDNNDVKIAWNNKPLIITELPTNNFILKYNNVVITAGDTIFNYNPALLTIEPSTTTPTGTTTTVFKYATLDAADVSDKTPANYTVTFSWGLPAKMEYFIVNKTDNAAKLLWGTTSEENVRSFNVQHSTDGRNWVNLSQVASLSANGNSNTRLSYNYTHTTPANGINYYCLQIVDIDAALTYSSTVTARFGIQTNAKIQLFPNPVKNQTLTIDGLKGNETITLFNMNGQAVITNKALSTLHTLNMHKVAKGVYYVQITTPNGVSEIHKIVKQ